MFLVEISLFIVSVHSWSRISSSLSSSLRSLRMTQYRYFSSFLNGKFRVSRYRMLGIIKPSIEQQLFLCILIQKEKPFFFLPGCSVFLQVFRKNFFLLRLSACWCLSRLLYSTFMRIGPLVVSNALIALENNFGSFLRKQFARMSK